jgi:hypothetical protein
VIKRFFAAFVAIVATLGLSFSLIGVSVGFAEGERPVTDPTASVGDASTSSSIAVPPWCGWRIGSLSEDVVLAPAETGGPADVLVDEPDQYTGGEITLEFEGTNTFAYIGGAAGVTSALGHDLDNCSWFSEPADGAQLNVTMTGSTFTASAAAVGEGGPRDDVGMNFTADALNPLITSSRFQDDCTAGAFVDGALGNLTDVDNVGTVWTVDSLSASTNNFCTFGIDYVINIPSGKSPLYGNTTYSWTGPTLTFTLQVPEE